MTKRAIVTGGSGFIGAHLCKFLYKLGWDVLALDDGSAAGFNNLNMLNINVKYVKADIRKPGELERCNIHKAEYIFHLAGKTSVANSVRDPIGDFRSNVGMTLRVLDFARKKGVRKVIIPSTASVYRPGVSMPVNEDAPISASSPYGAAKVACENYGYAYSRSYGLNVTVVRLFNVYGPLMRRFAIHDIVMKLRNNPSCLKLLGDGKQIREYLHVKDAVKAIYIAAIKGVPGEAYNVGSGIPVRIDELAILIAKTMKLRNVKYEYTNESWPGDIKVFYADISKIRNIGFEPIIGWERGLIETIKSIV